MERFKDLRGQRFGSLVVQEPTNKICKRGERKTWACLCDCGGSKEVKSSHLINGWTRSCGCWRERGFGGSFIRIKFHGTKEFFVWRSARDRAKRKGLEFNIEPADIYIPDRCPLLDIPLNTNKKGVGAAPNSPSLDRIDSTKGYTRDNIWVISHRANTMKSNGTLSDLQSLVRNWEKKLEELKKELQEAA